MKARAKLVALDYSSAVGACYANLKHYPNLPVAQGDIYALRFALGEFPLVYSLVVIQLTPDVAKDLGALPPTVLGGVCADFLLKPFRARMHAKYLFRLFTKRMAQLKLFGLWSGGYPVYWRLA